MSQLVLAGSQQRRGISVRGVGPRQVEPLVQDLEKAVVGCLLQRHQVTFALWRGGIILLNNWKASAHIKPRTPSGAHVEKPPSKAKRGSRRQKSRSPEKWCPGKHGCPTPPRGRSEKVAGTRVQPLQADLSVPGLKRISISRWRRTCAIHSSSGKAVRNREKHRPTARTRPDVRRFMQ